MLHNIDEGPLQNSRNFAGEKDTLGENVSRPLNTQSMIKGHKKAEGIKKKETNSLKEIRAFWEKHYVVNEKMETKMAVNHIYYFYQRTEAYNGETFEEFCQLSRISMGVRFSKTVGDAFPEITARPATLQCHITHQEIKDEEWKKRLEQQTEQLTGAAAPKKQKQQQKQQKKGKERSKEVDLYLVNMQGLITNRKNKCLHLSEVTEAMNGSKIIAVTETWGKKHLTGEYLSEFPGFDINVVDRKVTKRANKENDKDENSIDDDDGDDDDDDDDDEEDDDNDDVDDDSSGMNEEDIDMGTERGNVQEGSGIKKSREQDILQQTGAIKKAGTTSITKSRTGGEKEGKERSQINKSSDKKNSTKPSKEKKYLDIYL